MINELINKLKQKNEDIMNSCLNNYIQVQSDELGNKLLELQAEVNQEGYLKYKSRKTFSDEVSQGLLDSISPIAKNIGFTNYIKFLPLKLVGVLSGYIKNELFSYINANSPKNLLNKIIQDQFKNILSKVKKIKF